MKYEIIQSPDFSTVTIRDCRQPEQFRPAATGEDFEALETALFMESLEVEASHMTPAGFISSAAHDNRQSAASSAEREAVERISCATWWAHDLPVISSMNEELDGLTERYIRNRRIQAAGGYIRTMFGTGFVSAVILRDRTCRKAVLGSANHDDPDLSLQKALIEAIQSWVATQWLCDYIPKATPYWDIENLLRRFDELIKGGSFDKGAYTSYGADNQVSKITTTSQPYRGAYVAWSYGPQRYDGLTPNLARMFNPAAEVKVFSQYNN